MNIDLIIFLILAGVSVLGALGTVLLRGVVRNAIFLVVSFLGVAGIYAMLQADFLFAVQILIYVGAVSTLILFGIMLTRGVRGEEAQNNAQLLPAALLSALLFAVILLPVIFLTAWPASADQAPDTTVALLGQELMGPYALPFEVAGVLLLVALVGAIVVARERV